MIKPTMPAPDFQADAYFLGSRTTIRLSEYHQNWVVLFFYAGDFTFV
jgi:alkyl hydroperoxide reductase subunit AhpC